MTKHQKRLRSIALMLVATVMMTGCSREPQEEAATVDSSLRKGLQAHRAGRLEEAEREYRKVLELDSKNKYAYYNLGLLEQRRQRVDAAEQNYRLALSIDPNFIQALFNLAIIRSNKNDVEEAIKLYQQVITLQPGYAGAHLNLGFALLAVGRIEEGNAALAKAVELDPKLATRIPESAQTPAEEPSPGSPSPSPRR